MSQKLCITAITGKPNVGKSSLLNSIIGRKLAAVTHKPQTTRKALRGIYTEKDTQLIFVDTPGLFEARDTHKLECVLIHNALSKIKAVDAIICMFDITDFARIDLEILEKVIERGRGHDKKYLAVINKIDTKVRADLVNELGVSRADQEDLPKEKRWSNILHGSIQDRIDQIKSAICKITRFEDVFAISALNNDKVDEVKNSLLNLAIPGRWLFDANTYTDSNDTLFAEEMTLEQIYLHLHKELPYAIKVETDQWENLDDGSIKVHQTICVLKDSQKTIVIGKDGEMIKRIGQCARMNIEISLCRRVHLFLHVKVRKDWIDKLPFG